MTKHSLLWLFAIIAIFIFSPLFITGAKYINCLNHERSQSVEWYGEDESNDLGRRGKMIYESLMVSTRIDPLIREHLAKSIPNEVSSGIKTPKHLQPITSHLFEYWENLLLNVYLFCLRLSHVQLWLMYMLPFLFATVFDGAMTRKAKLVSFKYTSPTIYNFSWHMIIAIVSLTVVAISLPVPFPAFIYPTALFLIGFLIRLLVSNIQHSA